MLGAGSPAAPLENRLRDRRRIYLAERRKRFGLLLLAIMAVFAVEGIANPGRWQQVIASLLLGITLVSSLRVAEARPRVMRPIVLVAAVLTLLAIAEALAGNDVTVAVAVSNLLLVMLAPPAIVVGTVRTLRARREVTIEAVFGVLCLYLLLGMFFAFMYALVARLDGGSFFAQNVDATAARCLYFSFTTLTTVGYGDLTASSNLGHTMSVSEALVGQIYLVTIVSLIVGNLGQRRRQGAGGA